MLQLEIIRSSSSPFASPVVFLHKSYRSWCSCVDYISLNQNTIKDNFPIPLIDDLLDELFGATYLFKLDLWLNY